MTGDLFINGKDAWSTWGVRMGDGFLDAIDGFNQMKDYIEDESRLEHGKRIITENAKVASREITLQFTIEGGLSVRTGEGSRKHQNPRSWERSLQAGLPGEKHLLRVKY